MKKIAGLLMMIGGIVLLTACGNSQSQENSSEDKVIKVASQTESMVDMLNVAAGELEKDGWQLEVVRVNDNIQYNELLNNREIDANFAQHEPFMEAYNQEKGGNLVAVQKIYDAKVGFYSKDYQNVADIPEGSKVALPSDQTNEGRALGILAEQGLITLTDGVGTEATLKDVEANPKNFQWLSVDLLNLSEAYSEPNVALVYSYPTYIAKIGLEPADAIFLEKNTNDRFAISLVAREDNQDSEKIKALTKAMTSDSLREFLISEHSATLVPSF